MMIAHPVRRLLLAATAGALAIGSGGPVATAAPGLPPSIDVSEIAQTSATVDGSVDSPLASYYHVEYGTTASYGSSAPDPEGEKDPFVCPAPTAADPQAPDVVPPWWNSCVGEESVHAHVEIQLASLLPGTAYHVRLVAHDANGTSYGNDATFTTAPPGPAPVDVAPPTLHGRPMVGVELSCAPGRWSGAPTFAFSWLRDGAAIADATGDTYEPGAADADTQIVCRVTASSPGDADGVAQTPAVRIADEPLKIALLTRAASVRPDGTTRLRVSCRDAFERCRASLTLSLPRRHGHRRPPTLARAKVSLPADADGRVTLTLNRRGRQLLADAPRRHLAVSATLGAATHALQLAG